MQRPIIFVATVDPIFKQIAMDAVLESAHGFRFALELDDASQLLAQGSSDIALAIIDVDALGLELLKILGNCEPDFPILAIAHGIEELRQDESIPGIAVDYLLKPVAVDELRQTIHELCGQSEGTPQDIFGGSARRFSPPLAHPSTALPTNLRGETSVRLPREYVS